MKRLFLGFVILSFLAAPGFAQTPPPPKPVAPLAVIDGQPIYERDLASDLASKLLQLHTQEFQLESKALDDLIEKRLVEAEASKRGVSTDRLLEDEVDSKVPEPTEAEVRGYYLAIRNEINRPYEEAKGQLQKAVRLLAIAEARQEYARSLRKESEVVVLLTPPKVEVAYDPGRVRGNPNAPVTIVEFSDFQCPYCRRAQATLKDLLAKYNGQVKLAYRDFPMRNLHPQAQIAAEAARCAEAQGKFWPYYDALFADQTKLDTEDLAATATQLGLDPNNFRSCLADRKFDAAIDQDAKDGMTAGVAGTPAFFVNGEFVNGDQPEAEFVKIIDRELALARHKTLSRASR